MKKIILYFVLLILLSATVSYAISPARMRDMKSVASRRSTSAPPVSPPNLYTDAFCAVFWPFNASAPTKDWGFTSTNHCKQPGGAADSLFESNYVSMAGDDYLLETNNTIIKNTLYTNSYQGGLTGLTISFWINVPTINVYPARVFDFHSASVAGLRFYYNSDTNYDFDSGAIRSNVVVSKTGGLTGIFPIRSNEWVHCVVALRSSTGVVTSRMHQTYYVNGASIFSADGGYGPTGTNLALIHFDGATARLGASAAGQYMVQRLDDWAMWSRELSPTECSNVFNYGRTTNEYSPYPAAPAWTPPRYGSGQLVLWSRFDSTNTLGDSSGAGNNWGLMGGALDPAFMNGYVSFGGDDAITNADSYTTFGGDDGTNTAVAFWFFATRTNIIEYLIAGDSSVGTGDWGLSINTTPKDVSWVFDSTLSSSFPATNQWIHVVLQYIRETSSNHMRMWTNGAFAAQISVGAGKTVPFGQSGTRLRLGSRQRSGFERYFIGYIDDVLYYRFSPETNYLSTAEITNIYGHARSP